MVELDSGSFQEFPQKTADAQLWPFSFSLLHSATWEANMAFGDKAEGRALKEVYNELEIGCTPNRFMEKNH